MSESIFTNPYIRSYRTALLFVYFESDSASVVKYSRDEVYTIEDIIGMILVFIYRRGLSAI
jgi:hypothetical protein